MIKPEKLFSLETVVLRKRQEAELKMYKLTQLVLLCLILSLTPALTCSSTVAAAVIAIHFFHLLHNGFGQFLNNVIFSFIAAAFEGII